MSKWHDFLDGVQKKEDLESLIEEVQHELKRLKGRSLNEETRLHDICNALVEIKLKARVLLNKVSILEEDLDL
jgi:hypothetical protein